MRVQHYPVFSFIALLFVTTPSGTNAESIVLDFELTPPAGKLSVADIPRHPRSFVIDEPARFSLADKSNLEQSLTKMQITPTYVVLKKGKLPVPAPLYGNELLRRWTANGAQFSALILCVDTPLPKIFVILAGRNLTPATKNELLQLGNAALLLADNYPDQLEGLKATTVALNPALNTFAKFHRGSSLQKNLSDPTRSLPPPLSTAALQAPGKGQLSSRRNTKKTTSQWDLLAAKLDWNLIRTLTIITGCIFFLVMILVLLRRILHHRPLYFPIHQPRHRFSAPYSGGSNAQVKYGS